MPHVVGSIESFDKFWWRGASNGQVLIHDEKLKKNYAYPHFNIAHNLAIMDEKISIINGI